MAQYTGMVGVTVDYHYCPEISVPQQVDECIVAYKYIINELKVDPKKVFITGESAGGSLTLLTLQKLNKLGLAQPCGGIPISPQTDMSGQTAIKTEQEQGIKDAMFNICPCYVDICIDNEDRKEWEKYGEKTEERYNIARMGKYSALYGDWKGLCPLFITASEQEALVNDSKLIIDKCKEFGVEYESDFDPYLLHGTILFTMIPEARDKLIIVIEWMKKQLKLQNNK